MSLLSIFRPDACSQTKLAVIHEFDSLRIILDLHHWNDRSKGLLCHDSHVMINAREQCRSHKVAIGRWILEAFVLGCGVLCALVYSVFDVCLHSLR